jgi:hypothetical protein
MTVADDRTDKLINSIIEQKSKRESVKRDKKTIDSLNVSFFPLVCTPWSPK